MIRKIQTTVSNRRSSGGLEAARSRYIARAVKQGRVAEVKFGNSAAFKRQYNQRVRQNIVKRTESQINRIAASQNIGSEGRKLLRTSLSKYKSGTKRALQTAQKAAKTISSKGLRTYLNRQGFVRKISSSVRATLTNLELLRLQDRSEFYFKERELLLKLNEDRGNSNLIRQVKAAYKEHNSEELSEFMESAFERA